MARRAALLRAWAQRPAFPRPTLKTYPQVPSSPGSSGSGRAAAAAAPAEAIARMCSLWGAGGRGAAHAQPCAAVPLLQCTGRVRPSCVRACWVCVVRSCVRACACAHDVSLPLRACSLMRTQTHTRTHTHTHTHTHVQTLRARTHSIASTYLKHQRHFAMHTRTKN